MLNLFEFLDSDLLEKFKDLAVVSAEDVVTRRDIVGEELREEEVEKLQVSHHACLESQAKEVAKAQYFELTSLIVFVLKMLIDIFLSKRYR